MKLCVICYILLGWQSFSLSNWRYYPTDFWIICCFGKSALNFDCLSVICLPPSPSSFKNFSFFFFLMFCSLTILWLHCAFWIWGLVSIISSETSYSFFLTFPLSPFFSSRAPVRLMWELLAVFVITLNHSYFPSFECLCLIQESSFFRSFFSIFFFICN